MKSVISLENFHRRLGILPVENSARYCHSTTVAALSPTFGFGACTNPPRDLLNSDCILIMGSTWLKPIPAPSIGRCRLKTKGAVTIHVDPLAYTPYECGLRSHVHIRPETDIAFLSAVIRYILEKGLWFKEYVLAYTNGFDDHRIRNSTLMMSPVIQRLGSGNPLLQQRTGFLGL